MLANGSRTTETFALGRVGGFKLFTGQIVILQDSCCHITQTHILYEEVSALLYGFEHKRRPSMFVCMLVDLLARSMKGKMPVPIYLF